jgi:hypothetical protein
MHLVAIVWRFPPRLGFLPPARAPAGAPAGAGGIGPHPDPRPDARHPRAELLAPAPLAHRRLQVHSLPMEATRRNAPSTSGGASRRVPESPLWCARAGASPSPDASRYRAVSLARGWSHEQSREHRGSGLATSSEQFGHPSPVSRSLGEWGFQIPHLRPRRIDLEPGHPSVGAGLPHHVTRHSEVDDLQRKYGPLIGAGSVRRLAVKQIKRV